MKIADALRIIDAAADQSGSGSGATDETVQALRFLRDVGIERAALVWFWKSLQTENYIGRTQNANASRNRIRLLARGLPRG